MSTSKKQVRGHVHCALRGCCRRHDRITRLTVFWRQFQIGKMLSGLFFAIETHRNIKNSSGASFKLVSGCVDAVHGEFRASRRGRCSGGR